MGGSRPDSNTLLQMRSKSRVLTPAQLQWRKPSVNQTWMFPEVSLHHQGWTLEPCCSSPRPLLLPLCSDIYFYQPVKLHPVLFKNVIVCLWLWSVPSCVSLVGSGRRQGLRKDSGFTYIYVYEGMIYSNGLGCTFQLAKALWASLQKGYRAMRVLAFCFKGGGKRGGKQKCFCQNDSCLAKRIWT